MMTSNNKKPSLLTRNSSQLLQHGMNGLRRSLTTTTREKRTLRPSNSTSVPHYSLELKEYIPPPPLVDSMFDGLPSPTSTLTPSPPSQGQRILSPILENKQQLLFDKQPHFYKAYLSNIAYEFKKRIILSDRIKNGIEYRNVFDGKDAIDKLKQVLGMADRVIALRVGRALEAQRFFHDVNYEKRLVDDIIEIYQFNELLFHTMTAVDTPSPDSTIEDDEDDENNSMTTSTTVTTKQPTNNLPNGIYVDLTHCYTPTCNNLYPCYSYTCPKKERLRNRPYSIDTREKRVTAYVYEVEKDQPLWSQTVDEYIVIATPALERKRQETIFELIYTEENFLADLNYVITHWMEPLKQSDIIPKARRAEFIDAVFSNIVEIRDISQSLIIELRSRQREHPIISNISDIIEKYIQHLDPFVYYGSRQYAAKHIYELERFNNVKFQLFAEQTERSVLSRKLELNGYLTKPTTRLGRYTLLLDKIHSRTLLPQHPDKIKIPLLINTIKLTLQSVNIKAGHAKNQFDLLQIHTHLSFKSKKDKMNLKLLDENRLIIKQGTFRKTASLDSTEYQVLLLDHYIVIAKVKMINAVEHYRIVKRPIPIELLGVSNTMPVNTNVAGLITRKRSSSSSSNPLSSKISPTDIPVQQSTTGITFYHQANSIHEMMTLYAPSEQNKKSWQQMIEKQRDIKFKRRPIFKAVDATKRYEFFAEIKVSDMTVFDLGKMYMAATGSGVYVGPYRSDHGIPRKILPLEKATQVHVLEEYQLLLVLANNTLWQYPLDITMDGHDGDSLLNFGRKIRTNVPFFHVGHCQDQILICVPKQSVNGTEIDLFEPTMPKTELKKKSIFNRLSIKNSLSFTNTQVTRLKPIYSPCDVWKIDNTRSMLLLTTPLGMIAVDMRTKKADALLDSSDPSLAFVTRFEQVDKQLIHPAVKHISLFQVPNGHYLICYDKYAFYIDKKGRRANKKFKIEWEGQPTNFAYSHPHVVAFDKQFIEIRSCIDGHLEQVIQEKNIACLQNKKETILGTMTDATNPLYQHLFQLEPII